ncbi:hypothetical protein FACS1894167_13700 [Synergistales bacterium]|nr:hypothetical protein FACS1894167_13700 [Synergistales bacterium]
MENKYVYKGQDITTDVIMKIEKITRLIAEQKDCDFEKAYRDFLGSKTYTALQNTESLMWAESEEFIVDEYYRERQN